LSLWLVPAAEQLQPIRSVLPKRHDSLSSYPAIIPHITLASTPRQSKLTPEMLLHAIPPNQQAVRANFQSLVVSDHYFRSVLVAVHLTLDLEALRTAIMTALGDSVPHSPMFPHMSLCYILDEDAAERDRVAGTLRDTGVVSESGGKEGQTMLLRCGDVSLSGFDGEEIWVVNCEGPVEEWRVLIKTQLTRTTR
ncbi:2',3'-cyclic-nucleotide 3'-phosphodiesterase, partial [Phlebopus sp. FC_14]